MGKLRNVNDCESKFDKRNIRWLDIIVTYKTKRRGYIMFLTLKV